MKSQSVRSDQIPYANPGAKRRRRPRKRTESVVTTRTLSPEELAVLHASKAAEKAERNARRDRALELLGTSRESERRARRESRTELQFNQGLLDEEKSLPKRSTYRRKVHRD